MLSPPATPATMTTLHHLIQAWPPADPKKSPSPSPSNLTSSKRMSEANELVTNLIGTQVDLFGVGSSDPEADASPNPSPALAPALAPSFEEYYYTN